MSQSVRMRWVPFVLGLCLLASSTAHANRPAATAPSQASVGRKNTCTQVVPRVATSTVI